MWMREPGFYWIIWFPGAPISIAAVDFKGLNDQELEQMQKLLQKTVTEE